MACTHVCAGVVGAGSVVAGFVCERACRGVSVTCGRPTAWSDSLGAAAMH